MRCPTCGRPVRFGDPLMPFCSERCKLIDLGNWASERYVISTSVAPEAAALEEEGGKTEDER